VALIAPLLGSVQGKLGALSFRKGNRVQLKGAGGRGATSQQTHCVRLMSRYYTNGLSPEKKDWYNTMRGRNLQALLYIRQWQLVRDICYRGGGYDDTDIATLNIMPNFLNPSSYPPFTVPAEPPSSYYSTLNVDGMYFGGTWSGRAGWITNSVRAFAISWFCNIVAYDAIMPELLETRELDVVEGEDNANCLYTGVTSDSPNGRYGFLVNFFCLRQPSIEQQQKVPMPTPYFVNCGTLWGRQSIPANPEPEA
jgi:hypothetical protein